MTGPGAASPGGLPLAGRPFAFAGGRSRYGLLLTGRHGGLILVRCDAAPVAGMHAARHDGASRGHEGRPGRRGARLARLTGISSAATQIMATMDITTRPPSDIVVLTPD